MILVVVYCWTNVNPFGGLQDLWSFGRICARTLMPSGTSDVHLKLKAPLACAYTDKRELMQEG